MDCGSQDVVCQVVTWVTDNELVAVGLSEFIGRFSAEAQGPLGRIGLFLKENSQSFFAGLVATFGIWKTWRHREKILHERLNEYIGARDDRLKTARSQVLETIQRPSPGQKSRVPLFADKELCAVLRETRWDNTLLAASVGSSADWQLAIAVERISDKLQTAEREVACLRQELCTAYSIRGAIAATSVRDQNAADALTHVRNALRLASPESEVDVRELEAHQLRALGHVREAKRAYTRVIKLSDLRPERERDVIKARAKRYLAEMEGPRRIALEMMTASIRGARNSPGAIALLDRCTPLTAWELVEKGDMHYFAAYLANRVGFRQVEPAQLAEAKSSYEAAQSLWRRQRRLVGKSTSRLGRRISDGVGRTANAQSSGAYDVAWLPRLPVALNQAQKPAATVGGGSGDQPVTETA